MKEKKNLKDEIKETRISKGLVQKDMAKKVGVSLLSVCLWERGKSIPGIRNLVKISEVLDYPYSDLLVLWRKEKNRKND